MSIVVNSTPLISLAIIRQLDLLQKIFGDVLINNERYISRALYDSVLHKAGESDVL